MWNRAIEQEGCRGNNRLYTNPFALNEMRMCFDYGFIVKGRFVAVERRTKKWGFSCHPAVAGKQRSRNTQQFAKASLRKTRTQTRKRKRFGELGMAQLNMSIV